jgi:hypothetical protein
MVNLFDGTREPRPQGETTLLRVIDGNQKQVKLVHRKSPSVFFKGLPFHDNFGDDYTVIASADGFRQAGFTPAKLHPSRVTVVDLMLIPSEPSFDFSAASWDAVRTELPFLANGATAAKARSRYEDLMEDRPAVLAALLNLTTAMGQIFLPVGTPLDRLLRLKWDESLAQDRFFAYCDEELLSAIRTEAEQGRFEPEVGAALFHPGATASWKQVAFGEANVQFTFHEQDEITIDGTACIAVEVDIDYFRDPLAHMLLEVLPNTIGGGLTNPEAVYVLRWIASRRGGVPEFDPPYTIDT